MRPPSDLDEAVARGASANHAGFAVPGISISRVSCSSGSGNENNRVLYIVAGNLAVLILLAIILPHPYDQPGKLDWSHIELDDRLFCCPPLLGTFPEMYRLHK